MRQLDDGPPLWLKQFVVAWFACLGGIWIGVAIKECEWMADTIKRGYAEYNATTGEWQWKVDKTEAAE